MISTTFWPGREADETCDAAAIVFPEGHHCTASTPRAVHDWIRELVLDAGASANNLAFFTLGCPAAAWPPPAYARQSESDYTHVIFLDARILEGRFGMVRRDSSKSEKPDSDAELADAHARALAERRTRLKRKAKGLLNEAMESMDDVQACIKELGGIDADLAAKVAELNGRVSRLT